MQPSMETVINTIGLVGAAILIAVTGIFLISRVKHDNSIMDIFYGPVFFVATLTYLIYTETTALLPIIITICIGLWSTRLAWRIGKKNIGKPEDARYAAWREEWLKKGRWYFLIRSYLQVNILQGGIILLILSPFIVSTTSSTYNPWFVGAGIFIFLFGLLYESIADWQLDQFIAQKNAGRTDAVLMTSGLFTYCRRPNYFGEVLIWVGQAVMVLPLPLGYLGLIGPIVIAYVVIKLTGPILERQFLERYPKLYRQYINTTNYIIPGPKKKGVAAE